MSIVRCATIALLFVAATGSILDDIPDATDDDDDNDDDYGGYERQPVDGYGGMPYGDEQMMAEMMEYYMGGAEPAEQLAELFEMLDTDHNGRIVAAEIEAGLQRQLASYHDQMRQVHQTEAARVLADADADANGRLSLDEFRAAQDTMPQSPDMGHDELFAFADGGDGEAADGALTHLELADAMFPDTSKRHAEYQSASARAVLAKYDRDADAALNTGEYATFRAQMMSAADGSESDEEAADAAAEAEAAARRDFETYDMSPQVRGRAHALRAGLPRPPCRPRCAADGAARRPHARCRACRTVDWTSASWVSCWCRDSPATLNTRRRSGSI
jgi:hypothetical protein